uniref:clarin-2-like isoform X2 n=1 Tax=Pristiophorus japonicus TaxID=55135 RepID=UPI00398EBE31
MSPQDPVMDILCYSTRFSTVGEIAECSCSCFGYIFYLPSDCICFGQFWVLYLQCNENPLPSHKRTNGHLPLELDCKYMWIVCFIAAVKLHHHTEQIANFHEHVFKFIILQEYFDYSFWLCVASAVVHVVNMLVVRISGVRFPTLKTKTEEANVTPEDLMY